MRHECLSTDVKLPTPMLACAFWVHGVIIPAWSQGDLPSPGSLPESPGQVLPDTAPQPAPSIAVELARDEKQKPRKMTESESRQFVVHGADFSTRGAIASLAEATRTNLLEVMGKDEEGWEHAVAIQLRDGDAPVKMSFYQVPGGYRLQLDVYLSRGKPSGLERAILELLLIEYGLRGRAGEKVGSVAVPPWLVEGMLESFRWKRGERERALYAALFEKNELYPVKKLLETSDLRELDAITYAAFRGSAGALVMSLLEQKDGSKSMRSMLRELATFEGEVQALLLKHFPGMNLGPESFSKWWALKLAQMAEKPFPHVLTILETEKELQEVLVVRVSDQAGNLIEVGADQFRDLLALPLQERQVAIRAVMSRGGQFLYRVFPAHRPVLMEYLGILGEIAADRDEGIPERLAGLARERERLRGLGVRTRDYLEWYRITNSKRLTGDFESFVDLKERLEEHSAGSRGPVSEYLDSMQRLFEATKD